MDEAGVHLGDCFHPKEELTNLKTSDFHFDSLMPPAIEISELKVTHGEKNRLQIISK